MSQTATDKKASVPRAFEDRIIAERAKMRSSSAALWERVEKADPGPKAKQTLKKIMASESNGHLYFGLFPSPPVIERAKGAKAWDADGKEYIDFHSGFSVNILGHCNDEVNGAIKAQLDKLMQFAELPCDVRAEFSEKLSRVGPDYYPKKVQLTVTGGEAVEVAMKLSRWYTGKPMIITQSGDYHGRTAGAMAMTGKASMAAYHYPVLPQDTGITKIPFAYCYRCPFGKTYGSCEMQCVKFVEQQFECKETWLNNPGLGATQVAAMIVEPFQSSAGYIVPPPEFHQGLKNICDKYGILFVSDEVQTGMCRTGKTWGIEHSGVTPDLITVAKSLSNGLPISAVIGRTEILDSWGPGAHSTTFCGYPVACAGGVKVLEIIERDKIAEQVAEKGRFLADGLADLQKRHPLIGAFDCRGLYAGVEFVKDRKSKEPAKAETAFIANEALKNGLVFITSGYYYNRIAFAPPLVISKGEIADGLKVLDKVLTAAAKQFA